jgi:hypothetical protein
MTQEVLKLALEALETELSIDWTNNDEFSASAEKMYEAITAIKEALAQEKTLQALHSENERLGLYKDAYAQPEQEPVAWMYQEYRDDDQFGWRDEIQFVQPPNDPNYFRNIVPVYTTPPQRIWQGLTNEEVESYWDWEDFQCGCGRGTLLEMVLDIQAKLKERNT